MIKNIEEIYKYLCEKKCKDISIYDLSKESCFNDFVCIVSNNNNISNKKFALQLMEDLKLQEFPEGYNKGDWIVFDFGEFVIHSFVSNIRAKYNLDKLYKNNKLNL